MKALMLSHCEFFLASTWIVREITRVLSIVGFIIGSNHQISSTAAIVVCLVCNMTLGCGFGQNNSKNKARPIIPVEDGSYFLFEDETLASNAIVALLDEVIAAVATNPDAVLRALRPQDYDEQSTAERNCEIVDGELTERMQRESSWIIERQREIGLFSTALGIAEERERIWEKDDVDLTCFEKFFDVTVTDIVGVKVRSEHVRQKAKGVISKAEAESYEDSQLSVKGEWHIEWKSELTRQSTIHRRQNVRIGESTLTLFAEDNDKQYRSIDGVFSSVDNSPIITEDERSKDNLLNWITRIFESGELTANFTDNTRIDLRFIFLKFSSVDPCLPVSGTMTGSLIKNESDDEVLSFSADISGEKLKIVYDNQQSAEVSMDGCDFEDEVALDL
jgi:hypothetical protein